MTVYDKKTKSVRVGFYMSEPLNTLVEVMQRDRMSNRSELIREAIRRTTRPFTETPLKRLSRQNVKWALITMPPELRDYMMKQTGNLSEFVRVAIERMATEEGYL